MQDRDWHWIAWRHSETGGWRARALSRPRTLALLSVAALGLGLCLDRPAAAESSADAAFVAKPPQPPPLLDLPHLAPIAHVEPDVGALKELDRTLELLTSGDDRTRRNASSTLNEATPAMVEAIRRRLIDARATLDRPGCVRVLEEARKQGRLALKKGSEAPASRKSSASAKKGKEAKEPEAEEDGDWVEFLLNQADPSDSSWKQLTRVLAMTRMLTAIGTTPAVRELVQAYSAFGDLVRVDVQRQLSRLRDRAVPALIEARHHDAPMIQRWASKELDLLGRSIPGEAVGITDTQVLTDVLRAYGRTRDIDAFRAVLSFANSDRLPLRDAARESVAAVGEPGLWQLREAYTGLAGTKPPKDWTWDRVARELFSLYDQSRMAEVAKLMEAGLEAASKQDWPAAVDAYDKVLSRAPLFDRRKEMVPAYAAQARRLQSGDPSGALRLLRKALRLDPASPDPKLRAEVDALEALLLAERGTPDRFLVERALERDPANAVALQQLGDLRDTKQSKAKIHTRYLFAGGVAALTLSIMAAIAWWRPRPRKQTAEVIAETARDAEMTREPTPTGASVGLSRPSHPPANPAS